MTVGNVLEAWPALVAVLAVVMRAGLAWQSSLSWPEYRTAHGLKRWLFPALQEWQPLGYDSFVNFKGGRDDPEFLRTVDADVRTVARQLTDAGGALHLLNSVKYREGGYGDRLSMAHVVFLSADGEDQTEAYLFRNDDGTTDVFAHHEASPARPLAHLGADEQSDGDPTGVVTDALAA